jgi:hypothetical protein
MVRDVESGIHFGSVLAVGIPPSGWLRAKGCIPMIDTKCDSSVCVDGYVEIKSL